jgi:heat shock protein HtpX
MPTGTIDSRALRQHIWLNRLQSLLLLAVMSGFLALFGWLLWGGDGVVMLLGVGVVGVLFNPTISPRLVMRLYGASRIGPDQIPALRTAVSRLSDRAELPAPPELYYVPSSMLNAFAVGTRERSAIAVTDGLLRQLGLRELVGVLAHEVSHIRNNDLWVMGLADTFSRATSVLSLMGQFLVLLNLPLLMFAQQSINWFALLLLVFAPHLSALAQLALSRTREYDADLNAALLTADPEGLAGALAKIERVQGGWMERILMPGRRVPEPSLLRTHPETRERIARLMALKAPPTGIGEGVDATPFGGTTLGGPIDRPPRWHVSGLWH